MSGAESQRIREPESQRARETKSLGDSIRDRKLNKQNYVTIQMVYVIAVMLHIITCGGVLVILDM